LFVDIRRDRSHQKKPGKNLSDANPVQNSNTTSLEHVPLQNDLWSLLNDNAGALGFLLALLPLLWAAFTYISLKRAEQKQRRFENYHKLVQQLVERENPEKPKMLDRQLAVVFELGKYKEYRQPTLRILKGLKDSWSSTDYGPEGKKERLLEQIDETIVSIEVTKWFSR
jgi:hypothetical protein